MNIYCILHYKEEIKHVSTNESNCNAMSSNYNMQVCRMIV